MESPDKDKNLPPEKSGDESNWSHDIEERDYYYDDSTGYEVYRPNENENDDDDPRPDEKPVVS
jgi:hypothetical protein